MAGVRFEIEARGAGAGLPASFQPHPWLTRRCRSDVGKSGVGKTRRGGERHWELRRCNLRKNRRGHPRLGHARGRHLRRRPKPKTRQLAFIHCRPGSSVPRSVAKPRPAGGGRAFDVDVALEPITPVPG